MAQPDDGLQRADPEVVEELIALMMAGMAKAGSFSASDGISAALTMAMRMCHVIVELTPDQPGKEANAGRAAGILRTMAAELEMSVLKASGKVH